MVVAGILDGIPLIQALLTMLGKLQQVKRTNNMILGATLWLWTYPGKLKHQAVEVLNQLHQKLGFWPNIMMKTLFCTLRGFGWTFTNWTETHPFLLHNPTHMFNCIFHPAAGIPINDLDIEQPGWMAGIIPRIFNQSFYRRNTKKMDQGTPYLLPGMVGPKMWIQWKPQILSGQ